MQQHHDDNLSWVKDAERWICQLQGVRQSKIDIQDDGELGGIHVIATLERDPRLIVRDVEGLLKARLDLKINYKKISVVQIVDAPGDSDEPVNPEPQVAAPREAPAAIVEESPRLDIRPEPAPAVSPPVASSSAEPAPIPSPPPVAPWPTISGQDSQPAILLEEAPQIRVECTGVGLMVSGATQTATVELVRGGASAQAREMGPNHPGVDMQLIARATAAALTQLFSESASLSIADIHIVETAGVDLVLVAIDLVEGRHTERFFGVCSLEHSQQQASVYAVLDALNRRLELMSFKEDDTPTR